MALFLCCTFLSVFCRASCVSGIEKARGIPQWRAAGNCSSDSKRLILSTIGIKNDLNQTPRHAWAADTPPRCGRLKGAVCDEARCIGT